MPKTKELLNRRQKLKKYEKLKKEMNRIQMGLRRIKDGLEQIFEESSLLEKDLIRRIYALVEDIYQDDFEDMLNHSPYMRRVAKDYAQAGIWHQTRFLPPEPDSARTPSLHDIAIFHSYLTSISTNSSEDSIKLRASEKKGRSTSHSHEEINPLLMPISVDVHEFSQSMLVDSAEDAAPESSISSDESHLEEADSDDDYFPPYFDLGVFPLFNSIRLVLEPKALIFRDFLHLFPDTTLSLDKMKRLTQGCVKQAENRTDVCDICEVWDRARCADIPTQTKEQLEKLVRRHREEAINQQVQHKIDIDSLQDSECVYVLDYKENMKIPFSKSEKGQNFFTMAPVTVLTMCCWKKIGAQATQRIFTIFSPFLRHTADFPVHCIQHIFSDNYFSDW
ncbi:hypothetical protein BLNAU_20535 [Blattamonas nauphoetae]|uniref:Uncharacterized protein n=1 Tax=Blattamonas nauphoetae TaxID=2049346 RepID=A0ABQ9WZH9_9EUKA|nr:hypothetical protein BLNAU_20535 [Blattamonas nauphoetae]